MVKKKAVPVLSLDLTNTKVDLGKRWPWKDGSVDEIVCNNRLHLIPQKERIHFANELFRVLKPGAKATITTPYWSASKAYADPNAQWPPVVEYWFFHLNAQWRKENNPVPSLKCDFDFPPVITYNLHQLIAVRNDEYRKDAVAFYKEAAQDMSVVLTKKL